MGNLEIYSLEYVNSISLDLDFIVESECKIVKDDKTVFQKGSQNSKLN